MAEQNLVLLGPPGSGKGTQGERLQEDLRLPYYATGDILRAAVRDETELGRTAKEYMDRGDLVPDELIIAVIGERIQQEEASDCFILDGFPRTVPQAEALDEEMEDLGRKTTAVLLFDVGEEEIIRRLDSGEAGLRETLDLVREARALVELCAAELDAVGRGLEELRLDELVARLEQ